MRDTVLASADLKTYLKNIEDLEVMCYQQARLVSRLKQLPKITQKEITELEEENRRLSSDIKYENEFNKPLEIIKGLFFDFGEKLATGSIFGLICVVAGPVIWLISKIFGGTATFLPFLLWGIIIGLVLTLGITIYLAISFEAYVVKSAPAKINEYSKRMQEVTALLEGKRNSLETSIPAAILEAENHYQQSLDSLNAYYDAGIIYPKYRGIVPITTIYEYIASGRCTALEGHEGAYNLYESELRMNLIIGKLDDISSKLDQIADNQRLLVQEIRESNQKIDRLSQSVYSSLNKLDEIENNTELSAYYDRINASNTSYIAWLHLLNS